MQAILDLEKQSPAPPWIPSSGLQIPNLPITPKPPWHFRFTLRRLLFGITLICALGGLAHVHSWTGKAFGNLPSSWDRANSPLVASIEIPTLITWGQNLSSTTLLSGLTLVASEAKEENSVYHLGPSSYSGYTAQMDEFVTTIFPPHLQALYRAEQADTSLLSTKGWDGDTGRKIIWQTDKDEERVDGGEVRNWREGSARDEGWEWRLLTDE